MGLDIAGWIEIKEGSIGSKDLWCAAARISHFVWRDNVGFELLFGAGHFPFGNPLKCEPIIGIRGAPCDASHCVRYDLKSGAFFSPTHISFDEIAKIDWWTKECAVATDIVIQDPTRVGKKAFGKGFVASKSVSYTHLTLPTN